MPERYTWHDIEVLKCLGGVFESNRLSSGVLAQVGTDISRQLSSTDYCFNLFET